MKAKKDLLITEDARKVLREDFAQLRSDVHINVILGKDEKDPFNNYTRRFFTELAEISNKIKPVFSTLGDEVSKKYNVSRAPSVLVEPEKYNIRFTGAPAGEEARTMVITVIMVSTGMTFLTEQSRKRLKDLKEDREVKIFVSPTCPYCPQQAVYAISSAIEQPGLVKAEIIETYENRDLTEQYNAFSVPQTYINDQLIAPGLMPEEAFIESLLTAAPVVIAPSELPDRIERDLLIIGAGPAGLTASIYAERSGIKSVVVEKANIGGQVSITPVVENYPGFTRIAGKTLMDMMAQQAIQYAEIHEGEEVLEIKKNDDLFEVMSSRTKYIVKAILFTTGAESKKLNIPGEKEYQGRGVSYCAACDGYFFKDGKKVVVVGGGNTAATEALYLKNIGVDVTIIHRRDRLRAESFLQQSLGDNKIPIIWNSEVRQISGEKFVKSIVVEDTKEKTSKTMPVDGVFIAIGYTPTNNLAHKLGVDLDEEGYIKVDKSHRTNIKGIYAAGDITGGEKQIVTAVGQAAVAAMSVFEDLAKPYWKESLK